MSSEISAVWVERYRAQLAATSPHTTVRTYMPVVQALARYLEGGAVAFDRCTTLVVQGYLDGVAERTDKPRTVRLHASALRNLGRWAVDAGLWSVNHATDIEEPPETRTPATPWRPATPCG